MERPTAWRATSKSLFQIATTENRDVHLAVLSLFADRELTDPALTLEDILRALPAHAQDLAIDQDAARRSLAQLVEWGLLAEARNEAATYRTTEEFQRRNMQWALTADGQTAVAAMDEAARFRHAVASLQPAAIDSLASAIANVVALAAEPSSDPATIHVGWQQAEAHHRSLVDNIRRFHSQLAQLLGDPSLSDDVLARARDAIIEYLSRYIQEAELPASRAASALQRFHELGEQTVFERMLAGANLAPDPISGDPAPRWFAERRRRLAALDQWFLGSDGDQPRMTRLRLSGRDWVLQFLRVMDLRRAHRRRTASIADDFRALARGFAACEHDDDAHRLFIAGFELYGARHHTLDRDDRDAVDPATPASHNPAVSLGAALRSRRTTRQRTREQPVPDRSAQRARAIALQAERLAQTARLRAALITSDPTRLSTFAQLEHTQFRDLLDLVCAALTVLPASDGVRRTLSSDGQVEVVVYPRDTDQHCQLRTSAGVLTAPDLRVSIRLRSVDVATGKPGRVVDATAGIS